MHHIREVADSNPELNSVPYGESYEVSSSDRKMHGPNQKRVNLYGHIMRTGLQRRGAELRPSEAWCIVTAFRGVVQSYGPQRRGAELQSSEAWCRVTAS
jgi:hypothetical protein